MNYATQILTYLSQSDGLSEILLAPSAPPVEKTAEGIRIVLNVVLSAQDIRETLATFKSHAITVGPSSLEKSGVFSFGMSKLGRFRVTHILQRGTHVISVKRVPVTIPALETITANTALVEEIESLESERSGGIVLMVGKHSLQNTFFGYSVLNRINENSSHIIYIIERSLSFLMKHDKSVILQSELETDVTSIEEGIQNACHLEPDILYLKDIRTRQELLAAITAAESGILTWISATAIDTDMILTEYKAQLQEFYPIFTRMVKRFVRLGAQDAEGRLAPEMLGDEAAGQLLAIGESAR